jgi:hypothetical protein
MMSAGLSASGRLEGEKGDVGPPPPPATPFRLASATKSSFVRRVCVVVVSLRRTRALTTNTASTLVAADVVGSPEEWLRDCVLRWSAFACSQGKGRAGGYLCNLR